MIVYLLILGGLLYGSAAFASGPVYALAGIVLAMVLAVVLARRIWRRHA
jgi:hypothetical protein